MLIQITDDELTELLLLEENIPNWVSTRDLKPKDLLVRRLAVTRTKIITISEDEFLEFLEIAEEMFRNGPAEGDLLLLRIAARANNTYRQTLKNRTLTGLDGLLMGISQHDPNGNSIWELTSGSLKRRTPREPNETAWAIAVHDYSKTRHKTV